MTSDFAGSADSVNVTGSTGTAGSTGTIDSKGAFGSKDVAVPACSTDVTGASGAPAPVSVPSCFCRLRLTACAGVVLDIGGHRILIDALHNTPNIRWSTLTPEREEAVFALLRRQAPEAILFTHAHPDHYSPGLTERVMALCPEARVIRPFQTPGLAGEYRVSPRLTISWFYLPHMRSDAPYAPPNYAFLIECGGKRIFVSGDADYTSPEIRALAPGLAPDLAILNFPWLTLRSGRSMLEQLAPAHAAFVHLPFAEDDRENYIPSTLHAAERFLPDAAVMRSFLQEEIF